MGYLLDGVIFSLYRHYISLFFAYLNVISHNIEEMTKTVTIFGGSGFIGNHIVRRLSKLGYRIILPTSNLTKTSKLKIYGHVGQILPIKVNFSKHTTFKEIISLSDCIINLKTIWVETKNITYKKQIYDLNKSIINYI